MRPTSQHRKLLRSRRSLKRSRSRLAGARSKPTETNQTHIADDQPSHGRFGRGGLPRALVLRMYEDYKRLQSVEKAALLYGRTRQSLWETFKSHKLPLRQKKFRAKIVHRGIAYTMHKGYLRATAGDRSPLHHVIWTEANGLIPDGFNVFFRDGDQSNCTLTNLKCLPIAEVTRKTATGENQFVVRPAGKIPLRANDSRTEKPLTNDEIERFITAAVRLRVPRELRQEWPTWPLERRADFVRRIRARIPSDREMPALPFSTNVEPFDYGSERAHEIVRQSRIHRIPGVKVSPISVCSQGVIYRDKVFFWIDSAYYAGVWTLKAARPSLHRTIWEHVNRTRVPKGMIVRCADGNPNNLSPGNLVLAKRDEPAREFQAVYLATRSRSMVETLLANAKPNNEITAGVIALRSRRRPRR